MNVSILDEIYKDIRIFRTQSGKMPVKILIHPEVIRQILAESEPMIIMEMTQIHQRTIFGIPMDEDTGVNKWALESMTDKEKLWDFILRSCPEGQKMLVVGNKELENLGPFETSRAIIHVYYDSLCPRQQVYLLDMDQYYDMMKHRKEVNDKVENSVRFMTDK